MEYHAKDMTELADHFQQLAKDCIRKRDQLKKLNPRSKQIAGYNGQIEAYLTARGIVKQTKLGAGAEPPITIKLGESK